MPATRELQLLSVPHHAAHDELVQNTLSVTFIVFHSTRCMAYFIPHCTHSETVICLSSALLELASCDMVDSSKQPLQPCHSMVGQAV